MPQMERGLGEDARVDVAAEVERAQRVEHVRRQLRRVEPAHLHQVVGILGGQPGGHRQQARRRDRRDQRRRAHRARAEQPLDHRGAHRMADQHRRDVEVGGDALDVGRVVVEAGDEQRLPRLPTRRARAATARTTGSRAARSKAGNAAPSTTRRSSRRGRTAAGGRRASRRPLRLRAGRCERTSRRGSAGSIGGRWGSAKAVGPTASCKMKVHRRLARRARAGGRRLRATIRAPSPCPPRRKDAILPEAPPARSVYDAGCRRCTRLATFLDAGARGASGLLLRAGAALRRPGRAAADRRARAGNARRQRQRPAVHRRPRRNPALRDAACLRLRVRAPTRGRATTGSC